MAKRPPIPADLERLVLIECGHRCAIHTCRQVPVEIAHVTPWSRCRTHEFANLIALCPTCHTRYDRGQIDRKSMLAYKRDAWWGNARYSDLERRLLTSLAETGEPGVWVFAGLHWLVGRVVSDGLLVDTGESRPVDLPEAVRERRLVLTASGRSLVDALRATVRP